MRAKFLKVSGSLSTYHEKPKSLMRRKAKKLSRRFVTAAGLTTILAGPAMAASTIKLGVVGPMTGPFAVMGEHWRQGIEAYLAANGDTVNGHKIEILYRDTTGNPATARQLSQELVARDKVSFLGGYGLTPEANASVPVINEGKIPTFLFHTASPTSMTLSWGPRSTHSTMIRAKSLAAMG